MKKRIFYKVITFIMVILLVGISRVNAESNDGTCDLSEKSKFRQLASNVTATYVPIELDPEVAEQFQLDVMVYNLDDSLIADIETSGNTQKTLKGTLTSEYKNQDGAVVVRIPAPNEVTKVNITVYANEGDCTGALLKTLKLTLPKFNYYSMRNVCDDIPEYYLCQRYITYDINEDTFFDNVTQYKEKLAEQADEVDEKNNTSVVSKTIKSIGKYKVVIAGVIVLVGIVITVLVIKKKRSAF